MSTTQTIVTVLTASIGVICVAATFICQKMLQNNYQNSMNSSEHRMKQEVSQLKEEIQELRAQQEKIMKIKKRELMKKQMYSNDSTYTKTDDTDTYSVADTDVGNDEFFDCSDEETISENIKERIFDEVISEDPEILEIFSQSEEKFFDSIVYYKLKNLIEKNPNNVAAVWRFARTCHNLSVNENDSDQMRFILEGCDACEKLLHVQNCDLYKWYAILVGSKNKYLPNNKIKNGLLFKEYIDKALALNSQDGLLNHLMGRFKYEVADLSWIEKKLASSFAQIPTATYKDAIEYFQKAEQLMVEPHYENKLYLGKSYIKLRNYNQGMTWLKQICSMYPTTDEENKIQSAANELVIKYSDYCT